MIARADMCIFSKKNEPQLGSKLFIRRLGSNPLRAHWFCNFVRGMETHGVCVGKAIAPDYYLYNEYANFVGTLKAFQFDRINSESDYELVFHDHLFQCTLDLAMLGNATAFQRYANRELVLPQGGNLQSVGGDMAGIGNPAYMKSTRR
jgi:hypothetical protein